jgi:hypothetical protein
MPEIVNIPFPEDETLPPLSTTNEGGEDVAAEDGTTTTTTTTTPKKSHNRTGKKATADVEYPNILHSSYQTYMNGGRNAQLPKLHGNSFKWSEGISGIGEVWCLACNYRLVEVSDIRCIIFFTRSLILEYRIPAI